MMVWPAPASTVGARLTGGSAKTSIVTVSDEVNWPSSAVSSSTYVPTEVIDALVVELLALANTTGPGPLTTVH